MAKSTAPNAPAPLDLTAVKPQELAERLADPVFQSRIEHAIEHLPPDKAAELVALLESSIRRRKIELFGYLAAAGVLLVGMIGALYAYGAAAEGRFVGWVFLMPLALAGLVMVLVGRMAKNAEAAERAAAERTADAGAGSVPRSPSAKT
jgi:hypothetical protein